MSISEIKFARDYLYHAGVPSYSLMEKSCIQQCLEYCCELGQRRPVYSIRAATGTLALPPGTTSHDLLDCLALLYRSTTPISSPRVPQLQNGSPGGHCASANALLCLKFTELRASIPQEPISRSSWHRC